MIVYELIKDCDIRYRTDRLDRKKTHIPLKKGDLIFFSENKIYLDPNKPLFILKDIYYKKNNNDNSPILFNWTWKRNVNMLDPYINISRKNRDYDRIIHQDDSEIIFPNKYLKDVSNVWNRDEKLNYLLK